MTAIQHWFRPLLLLSGGSTWFLTLWQGYTVVDGLFTDDDLQPTIDSYNELVDGIAQKLYKAGKIKNLYEDHGFETRLTMLEKEWEGAVVLLLKQGELTQAFRDLWSNDKLLNAVEQLLGPDIAANPIWNTRPKAPGNKETIPPIFDLESYKSMIITAWIPLVDTNKDNGCMHVVAGAHRKGLVATHKMFADTLFYVLIDDKEIENTLGVDVKTNKRLVEIPKGSVLFFNNLLPHGSDPNISNGIRWAMDLRFQRPDKPFGFWELKQGLTLRSSKDPLLKPDWDAFCVQDRYKLLKQFEKEKTGETEKEMDPLDTTITAPHFEKWEIIGTNKHLETYFNKKK
ncbi:hypothetical protein ScPMuIL_014025 [Solemya velum]